MVIRLAPDIAEALEQVARQQGISPEDLAVEALRERFLGPGQGFQPRDEWERQLLEAGTDCGRSLSNEAVGSEGLYE